MPVYTAQANPRDGVVSNGQASITESGKNLNINQSTDKAVIDWRSFNIAPDESTRFNQPSSGSVTLNRINDVNPSAILGSLSANGSLVLVNPNGMFFGPGATVDVSGLVASTADIGNADFMNGRFLFNKPGKPNASIVNYGSITARSAGLIGLIAPEVANHGILAANLGRVHLASGDTATVDLYGDGLMEVAVSDAVKSQLVSNTGTIEAAGGTIALTAAAGKDIVSSLIEVKGEVKAPTVVQKEGKIYIFGESSQSSSGNSRVEVSGKISAKGDSSGTHGGNIDIFGDDIAILNGARINVSGDSGGGTVHVGGAYQGKGPTPHARTVTMEEEAVIRANAFNTGNGGEVILWSDESTDFLGNIFARGGAISGNGGLVETSGHNLLATGSVNASATNGTGGLWFLDPVDITINQAACVGTNCVSADDITTTLAGGTNVTIATDGGTGGNGDITVNGNITPTMATADATFRLNAHDDIFMSAGIAITASGANKLHVIFNSDSDGSNAGGIMMPLGSSITSNNGNVTFSGGIDITTGYAKASAATENSAIRLEGAEIATGTGNIVMRGDGLTAGAGVSLGETDNGSAASHLSTTTGNITLTGIGTSSADAGVIRIEGWWYEFGPTASPSTITTVNGAISLSGTATTNMDYGVNIAGFVDATGTGTIDITTYSDIDAGIVISNLGRIQTNSGNINVINTFSGAWGGLNGAGEIKSTTGNINLVQDTIVDAGSMDIETGGILTIRPYTTKTMVIDNANVSINGDILPLSTLNLGTTGSVVFGDTTTTGAMTVNTNYAFTMPVSFLSSSTISVNGDVSSSATGAAVTILTAGNLTLDTNADILVTGAGNIILGADGTLTTSVAGNTIGHGTNGTATGNITLRADTLALSAATLIKTDGNVTFAPYSDARTIGVNGGAGDLAISTTDLGYVDARASGITIGCATCDGTMNISYFNPSEALTLRSDTGAINLTNAAGNILIMNGLTIVAGNAAVTLSATGNITNYDNPTTGADWNITTNGGAVKFISDTDGNDDGTIYLFNSNITTSGGSVLFAGGDATGTGYATGNNWEAIGLEGVVITTGAGNITMRGEATNGGWAGVGIYEESELHTTSGNISLTGIGGDGFGAAAILIDVSNIDTTTGSITIVGSGNESNNSHAVNIKESWLITTGANADISITGTSGTTTGSAGVAISDFSIIAADGADITIEGTGGFNDSAFDFAGTAGVSAYWTDISSSTGTVTIIGHGGINAGAAGSYNFGVDVGTGANINSDATGTIIITGTGGTDDATGNSNFGVSIKGTVANDDGNITITGIAGAANSDGIWLRDTGAINSTGSGNITINATGAAVGNNWEAIFIQGDITSTDGDITITATMLNANAYGIYTDGTTIGGNSATGDITINSNKLDLENSTIKTTGNVNLKTATDATTIGIGGGAGTLNVDDTELNFFDGAIAAINFGSNTGDGTINVETFDWSSALGILSDTGNVAFTNAAGDLDFDEIISITTDEGNVTFTASGNIIDDTGWNIITDEGNVTFHADSDNNNDGYIYLEDTSVTTGGGFIKLGGGSSIDTDYAVVTADVNAGITLDTVTFDAGGGNIQMRGLSGAWWATNIDISSSTIQTEDAGNISIIGDVAANSGGIVILDFGNGATTITAETGTITLTGAGGARDGAHGMRISDGTDITTTTGNIILTGTGTDDDDAYGIGLANGTQVSTAGGNITINAVSGGNAGLELYGAEVSTTGAGNIIINATGPTGTTDAAIYSQGDNEITTTNGNITITAITPNAGSKGLEIDDDWGLMIGGDSTTGDITIIANSWDVAPAGAGGPSAFPGGVRLQVKTTGDLIIKPYTDATTIGIAGGAGILNLDATYLSYLNLGTAASLTIGSATGDGAINIGSFNWDAPLTVLSDTGNVTFANAAGTLTFDEDVTVTTDEGTVTFTATDNISSTQSINVTTGGAAVSFISNTDGGANGHIYLVDSTITTNGGNILVAGGDATGTGYAKAEDGTGWMGIEFDEDVVLDARGGAGGNITLRGTSDDGSGVSINGASILRTNGTGSISITGTTGEDDSDYQSGVIIWQTGTLVSVVNGNLTINGTHTNAAWHDRGAWVDDSAIVETTGSGNITITGALSTPLCGNCAMVAANVGDDATIRSTAATGAAAGDITITGTIGGVGYNSDLRYGIGAFIDNADVTSVDGNISITGNSGITDAYAQDNQGVSFTGNGNDVFTTGTGNITITGKGAETGGSSDDNVGVILQNGFEIYATTGNISITGTGSTDADGDGSSNTGFFITNNGTVWNTNGNITLTGIAGNNESNGIILNSSIIVTDGTGNISITGTGSATGVSDNEAIYFSNGNPLITATASGNISITANRLNTNDDALYIDGGFIGTENSDYWWLPGDTTGDITITTDTLTVFDPADFWIKTTGDVIFRQYSDATTIGVAGGAGILQITSDILDGVDSSLANSITIGRTTGDGAIAISNHDWNSPLTVLSDTGNVTFTNAAGNLDFDEVITVTTDEGNVTFTASGNIIDDTGWNITTDEGNVTFHADSDNNNDGYISLIGVNVTTGGGFIKLGGGSDIDTDYAVSQEDNFGGIEISVNSVLNAGGGDISMRGRGEAEWFSTGVDIDGGTIQTSGAGTISIVGISVDSAGGHGIATSADFIAETGTITLNGTNNISTASGILLNSASVTTTTGHINVTGTNNNTDGGKGLAMEWGSDLITDDGNITVTGTAGAWYGVFMHAGADIIANGTGNIVVTANGPTDTTEAAFFNEFGGSIATTSGNITLTANVRNAGSTGIVTEDNGVLTIGGATTTGDISIITNSLLLDANSFELETTGDITLRAYTDATTIGIAGGTGDLNYSATYLGYMNLATAASLTIGSATGDGAINIGSYDWDAPLTVLSDTGNVTFSNTGGALSFDEVVTVTTDEGNITFSAATNIINTTGSALTTGSGRVMFNADSDAATPAAGYISLASATITTSGGNVIFGGGSGLSAAPGTSTNAAWGSATTTTTTKSGITLATVNVNAGGGNIYINGHGMNQTLDANDDNNYGVYLNGGTFQTTGTGVITINGTGGTSTANNSDTNYGVYLNGATVSNAGTGGIGVTGSGGGKNNSGSDNNYGIYLDNTSAISSTSSSAITVTGSGGGDKLADGAAGKLNYAIFEGTTGQSTIGGASATGNILIVAGTSGYLSMGGVASVRTTGSGTVTFRAAGDIDDVTGWTVQTAGGNVTFNSDYDDDNLGGIYLSGTDVTTNGGHIMVSGGDAGLDSDYAYATRDNYNGVDLDGSVNLNAGGGDITIRGHGWTASGWSFGVSIAGDGSDLNVQTSGTGNITIVGVGNDLPGGYGVWMSGDFSDEANITAAAGNIVITGTGGDWNDTNGITLTDVTKITTTTGNITLTGSTNGSADSVGIYMNWSSSVTTADGTISLIGSSGSEGGFGIEFWVGAVITATNNGNIIITATGPSADLTPTDSAAFATGGATATVSAKNGNITITAIRTDVNSHGIYAEDDEGMIIGGDTAVGNITLISDDMVFDNYSIKTTGIVTVKTYTDATTIGLAGGTGDLNLSSTELGYFHTDISSLIFGSATGDGAINISNHNWNSPLTVLSDTGNVTFTNAAGNLDFDEVITVTTDEGNITFIATGSIIDDTGWNITTGGGNVVFNSDSDGNDLGYIDLLGTSVATDGGNITLGGHTNAGDFAYGTGDGVDGVSIGTDTLLNAQGGNITIRGHGTLAGGWSYGVAIDSEDIMLQTSGAGNITIIGTGNNFPGGVGVRINGGWGEGGIAAEAGTITITGTGGDWAGAQGVEFDQTAVAYTTSGNINITGTTSSSDGDGVSIWRWSGVYTDDGTITINGTSGTDGDGIDIFSGGYIEALDDGHIILTGTAGTDADSHGIWAETGAVVYATDGNVTITAITPNSASTGIGIGEDNGLTLGDTTSTGDITVITNKIAVDADNGPNLVIETTGDVTFRAYTDAGTIGVAGGAGDLQLTSAILGSIDADVTTIIIGSNTGDGTINIGNYNWNSALTVLSDTGNVAFANAAGALDFDEVITVTTDEGNITFTATGDIVDDTGWNLTTGGGNVTFTADSDGNNAGGINFVDTSVVTNGGDITLGGGNAGYTGGNTAFGDGIDLDGVTLDATGNGGGIILLRGRAYVGSAWGVWVGQDAGAQASVIETDGTGTITLTGIAAGGGSKTAVAIGGESTVSTENGDITLSTSAASNRLYMSDDAALVVSGTGNVIFNATNHSTVRLDEASITTNGGNITLGDADSGALTFVDSVIDAAGGNITLTGHGYEAFQTGVSFGGTTIETIDNGTITITGIGSANGNQAVGVNLGAFSSVSTEDGNITLTGTGVGGASDAYRHALYFYFSSVYTDGGNISLNALNTGDLNAISLDGSVSLGDAGTTGNITLSANTMDFGGANNGISIRTTGTVTVKPYEDSITIGLGDDSTGTLNLDDYELGFFHTNITSLVFGSATGDGAINIASYDWNSPLTVLSDTGNVAFANAAGALSFDEDVTVTTDEGTVTFSATGNITSSAAMDITTDGGDVKFISDIDGSSAGYIHLSAGSSIVTNGGNVLMAGGDAAGTGYAWGSATTDGITKSGISLDNTTINAGGGNITLRGKGYTGGVDTNLAAGINLSNTTGTTSGSGSITISGTGGGSGTGANNNGVGLSFSNLTSGTGGISITGNSGSTSGNGSLGVYIESSLTSTGSITIIGNANGTGWFSTGVTAAGSTLSATNNIAITGTGGDDGNGNHGLVVANDSTVSTTTGTITLTGILGDDSTGSYGIQTDTNTITIGGNSQSGAITLIADTVSFDAGTNIETTGALTIRPYTSGTSMLIGTNTGGAETLQISDAYLGYMNLGTASSVTFGGTTAGAMEINSAVTFANPVTFRTGATYDINLTGNLASSNTGAVAVVLASGDDFINGSSSTITTGGGGRWIIYSEASGQDTKGGLTQTATIDGETFGTLAPGAVPGTTNTWVYSSALGNTITFTADIISAIYGNTPVYTYTFACSTGCLEADVVTGGTISLVSAGINVGSYLIDASVGSLTFDAAYNGYTISFVDRAGGLTINARDITLDANDQNKTYGNVLTTNNSTQFTRTAGTLASGESITSVDLAVANSGATAAAGVAGNGTYTISVSGDVQGAGGFLASNYNISYTTGALTVDQRAITLDASDQTKMYGNTLTTNNSNQLTLTSGTYATGESVSTVDLAVANSGATAGALLSGNGTYTISISGDLVGAGGFDAANYSISYTTGALTLTQRDITLTSRDRTKTYGDTLTFGAVANTDYTVGGTGLAAGDAITALSLVSSGSAAAASVAGGPYGITISAASGTGNFNASNYAITYTSTGTITVDQRDITLKANDQNKTFGNVLTTNDITQFTRTAGTMASGESVTTVDITVAGGGATAGAGVGGNPYTISITGGSEIGGGGFAAGNYNITYDTGDLTIDQRAITVTAANQTKTYGDTFTFAGTEFTYTGTLATGDTLVSATLDSTGKGATATRTGGSAGGATYAITAASVVGGGTFDIDNYAVTYANGTMTLTRKALTVTGVTATSREYDGSLVAALGVGGAALIGGGVVNGDDITLDTSAVTGAFADKNVANGIAVTGSGFALGGDATDGQNYSITQPAYMTANITPRAITLKASDQNKTYGNTLTTDNSANFTRTVGTMASGETITTVDLAVANSGATASAGVAGNGTYTISITGGEIGAGGFLASNYDIDYDTGDLTIDQRTITLTANSFSKTEGQLYTFNGTEYAVGGSGLATGDTISTIDLASDGADTLATIAAPGPTYAITIANAIGTGGFDATNYDITYTDGTMTLQAAAPSSSGGSSGGSSGSTSGSSSGSTSSSSTSGSSSGSSTSSGSTSGGSTSGSSSGNASGSSSSSGTSYTSTMWDTIIHASQHTESSENEGNAFGPAGLYRLPGGIAGSIEDILQLLEEDNDNHPAFPMELPDLEPSASGDTTTPEKHSSRNSRMDTRLTSDMRLAEGLSCEEQKALGLVQDCM